MNPSVRDRLAAIDWSAVGVGLGTVGIASTGGILDPDECAALKDLYGEVGRFRSTIDMARHRFGQGEYRYFDRPLPEMVAALRHELWPHLLPIAREWSARRDASAPWPDELDEWLASCHAAGQERPTPLMLRYGPGDWNALHRDLYGDFVFPLQVVIGLDEPCVDYTGGEFVVVEQRPRAQSRATTVTIPQGHGLVFTTRDRPVRSQRGWVNAPMRHGVSVVRTGQRHALGLVFHDAR
jgi:uncharacterized protein